MFLLNENEIVVGVDESEGAAQALLWAVHEAAIRDWKVTALLAWSWLDQHSTDPDHEFTPAYDETHALEALWKITESVVGPEAAAAIDHQVVCDLPARALVDAAAGRRLLVVGARGLGGFRGLLMGSVSQRCLRHSTTPVAIIREYSDAYRGRVVAAVDGSETANRALRWALEEARARRADLEVIHAWHPPYIGAYLTAPMMPELDIQETVSLQVIEGALIAVDADQSGVAITRTSTARSPAAAILDAGERADLVVMGSRGLGAFKGALLGSVAMQVTHHAICPVVVVPPASDELSA